MAENGVEARHDRRGNADRLTLACIGATLFAATVLQRFGLPLGDGHVPVNLLVTLAALAVLAVTNRLLVVPGRLLLFATVAIYLMLSSLLQVRYFSYLSLAFALTLYGCFIFVARADEATRRGTLSIYQSLVAFCSLAGLAQFFVQFIYPDRSLFSWENWVPPQFLIAEFNMINELFYESGIIKSNGFFLLEASILSQYVALAVIIELMFFRPGLRLVLFAAAMVVTFSGTGLSLLALFAPYLLWRRFSARLALLAMAVAAVLALAAPVYLEIVGERIGEFASVESSGFARFIAPFWMLSDLLFVDIGGTFFGYGSGAVQHYIETLPYVTHDPTWSKLLFEYGVVGFVLFMGFFAHCLLAGARSLPLSLALGYVYLFLGGMFLDARLHAIILCLAVLQGKQGLTERLDEVPLKIKPAFP